MSDAAAADTAATTETTAGDAGAAAGATGAEAGAQPTDAQLAQLPPEVLAAHGLRVGEGGVLEGRVKVNGEEAWEPLEEIRNGRMRQRDYTKKTQAAKERAEAAEATMREFEANPGAALKKRGKATIKAAFAELMRDQDPDTQAAFAELYAELTEEAKLSDEQRELRATKAELEKRKKEDEERAKGEVDKRIAARAEAYQKQLTEAFDSALTTAGVPGIDDPEIASDARGDMAAMVEQLMAAKTPVSREMLGKLAEKVRDKYRRLGIGVASKAKPEELIDWLGEEPVKGLREYDLKRLREKQKAAATPAKPAPSRRERAAAGPVDTEDLLTRRSRQRWGR